MVVNTHNGREDKTTEKCLSELQIYFRKFISDKSGTFDIKKYQEIRLLYANRIFLCFSLEPKHELLVYIRSVKVVLVAFLLALILFTILIIDFTLCRQKKGFLYALCCCSKNNNMDNVSNHCT